jgi:hypothetical protein
MGRAPLGREGSLERAPRLLGPFDSLLGRRRKIRARRRLRRAVSALHLRRLNRASVPEAPREIRLFMVVRNESLRLPYVLDYYSSLGVDRMFVIDNDSTDDTVELLLSRRDIHVFQTSESYVQQAAWVDLLLRRYGTGHWCLVVDADELLIYPHYERLGLREFCAFLDRAGHDALDCLLLDMYSDKPVCATAYECGSDPLACAPYFDPDSHRQNRMWFPQDSLAPREMIESRFYGGMRGRVFGLRSVCLSKFPLLKFEPRMFLSAGTHLLEGAGVADIRGALLHFKFLGDLPTRVYEEVRRGEHADDAREYKYYLNKLKRDPDFSPYHPGSQRFAGSDQLIGLGILESSADLERVIRGAPMAARRDGTGRGLS